MEMWKMQKQLKKQDKNLLKKLRQQEVNLLTNKMLLNKKNKDLTIYEKVKLKFLVLKNMLILNYLKKMRKAKELN